MISAIREEPCIESHEDLCRLYLHSQRRRGRKRGTVESRGSHDYFHRVILDFKKESPGSVLLLRASRAEYSAAG